MFAARAAKKVWAVTAGVFPVLARSTLFSYNFCYIRQNLNIMALKQRLHIQFVEAKSLGKYLPQIFSFIKGQYAIFGPN